ncbi:MAG: YbaB/EbfC family nucleoid-associated protein [Thalassobaculaceae bacterium]
MKNIAQMMKQAQEMQGRVEEMQNQLQTVEVTGESGAGMVTVSMTGKGMMRSITIDPSLAAPGEVEVLEDLIVAAVNDARQKAEDLAAEEMRKLTGGLSLPPGFKLPF